MDGVERISLVEDRKCNLFRVSAKTEVGYSPWLNAWESEKKYRRLPGVYRSNWV